MWCYKTTIQKVLVEVIKGVYAFQLILSKEFKWY